MTAEQIRWIVPQAVLNASYKELASNGARGREGIALWAGVRASDGSEPEPYARITHVVLLRGPGVIRGRGYISITPELLNEVTDALAEADEDLYLVGQIHGHPPMATTDLSEVDIAYGIRTPQYLSVVAPCFGMSGNARVEECGVHVFDRGAGWRRLGAAEVAIRVQVVDVHQRFDVTCLSVGDDRHA
jgi:hypothetical protein